MKNMNRWKVCIKNSKLKKIYDTFLYRANELLIFYLSCCLLDEYIEFNKIDLDQKISASDNFHESLTSIRSISDIKDLINSGSFSQNYRKQTFIALITAFNDLLEEILDISRVKKAKIKEKATVDRCTQKYCLNTAGAKIIYRVCEHYGIHPVICDWQGITYINNLFNIRNIIIHSKGIVDEKEKKHLVAHWANMKHGDTITFTPNQFDAIFWFICDHLKTFISSIDKKLDS
ncbi:MAG: hypothetical protein FWF38_00120 [Spirochaetaceae bacterium]|nr:hypothetical protein [Spirochaetaceae bacterium]